MEGNYHKTDLSVKPTVAASAGTKLPIWDKNTIRATWKVEGGLGLEVYRLVIPLQFINSTAIE